MSGGRFVPSHQKIPVYQIGEKKPHFLSSSIIMSPPPLSESHTAESLRNLFPLLSLGFSPRTSSTRTRSSICSRVYPTVSRTRRSFDFVTPLLMELFEGDDEDEARAQCTKAHDLLYGKGEEEGSSTKEEETTQRVKTKLWSSRGRGGKRSERGFEAVARERKRPFPDFSTNTNHRNQNEDKAQEKEQRKMRKTGRERGGGKEVVERTGRRQETWRGASKEVAAEGTVRLERLKLGR